MKIRRVRCPEIRFSTTAHTHRYGLGEDGLEEVSVGQENMLCEMVRTYKRTGAYFKWTNEQLNSATKAVAECNLSVRAAAAHFDIPYETLRRNVSTEKLRRS
ncbi:hypothetical protein PR048_028706 [Dryococelus australis]|uniref:HTH psq-type domain-containing protein n=1 Tax=Dryococelus australis TaxID=614101 RepID=A0ABQ9GDV0_9NEOP|nr:hypothetical protein PR048_028706 [Dryococelus australis]